MCILTILDIKTPLPLDISSYLEQVQQETIKAEKMMKLIKKQKENDEPPVFNNCIMDNIKKPPFVIINEIINYIPGVIIKPIFSTEGLYSGLLIKDIRLECYKKIIPSLMIHMSLMSLIQCPN